jgi:hypothetical protein
MIILDPPLFSVDVHCPPLFKFHVVQLNDVEIVRGETRASGLGHSQFYAEGGTGGSAPAFEDAHNFEALLVPLECPRLLGVGIAGVAFHADRNAHSS